MLFGWIEAKERFRKRSRLFDCGRVVKLGGVAPEGMSVNAA